ncbi:hypothetical protein Tco_0558294 [Tanacetum coccineum]
MAVLGKVIAYAFTTTKPYEVNYPAHDLELAPCIRSAKFRDTILYVANHIKACSEGMTEKSGAVIQNI